MGLRGLRRVFATIIIFVLLNGTYIYDSVHKYINISDTHSKYIYYIYIVLYTYAHNVQFTFLEYMRTKLTAFEAVHEIQNAAV